MNIFEHLCEDCIGNTEQFPEVDSKYICMVHFASCLSKRI